MTSYKYDLHSHSNASDGALTPTELIQRAQAQGVNSLALTDHDTISGIQEAQLAARKTSLTLIPGIEISCTWNKKTFHIVGLNIDIQNSELLAGTQALQNTRAERAKKIAFKLEKNKIPKVYEAVLEAAGQGMITRTHFADFLLKNNYVSSMQGAFDHYLGQSKPAFVSTQWAELENAVHWITAAGGVAVLAHPMRYKLTASWMRRFLSAFKEAGGQGIEIITARSNPDEIRRASHFAQQFELHGSIGSDFHTPKNQWVELGRLTPLPINIPPIWSLFTH